jgi:UDP-N-acetylglucosamine 2-epimerase (non-hydrolysing)
MGFHILCIAGARPNFMKVAPLFRAFAQHPEFYPVLLHTGQHYDESMSGQFFRDLGLPCPAYNLDVGSGSHAQQTAEIMKRFEPIAVESRPDALLVVGDVNSTLACALVAAKLGIPVVHVEAGLRSFDRTMPEEINRVVTDAVTSVFLVSEESGIENLRREGIAHSSIYFVGNLMIDSLYFHLAKARQSDVAERLGMADSRYGLVTLHRPANVDDSTQLIEIMGALNQIAAEMPLYFPVHPRTRAKLSDIARAEGIRLLDPLGYVDFLALMSRSAAVFTDSGGIQDGDYGLGDPVSHASREHRAPDYRR